MPADPLDVDDARAQRADDEPVGQPGDLDAGRGSVAVGVAEAVADADAAGGEVDDDPPTAVAARAARLPELERGRICHDTQR